MSELTDHKKDGTAVLEAGAQVVWNGVRRRRQTTQGWKLCSEWKDGSTTWETLRELKESHPVTVTECAVANKMDHEPAFAWWVHKAQKKRELQAQPKAWDRAPKDGEESLANGRGN